ncbi:MAG: hypothetical protein WBK55_08355 [Alphaproteobacteria bacterium]
MWNAPQNTVGPYYYTIDHLQTLMRYDLEFEPRQEVIEAIEYLLPKAQPRRPVQLYKEALRTNNPEMLEIAKAGLQEAFARYSF